MLVGINDRGYDFNSTTSKRMDTLLRNATQTGYQFSFIRVPTGGENIWLSDLQIKNINAINDHAKNSLGTVFGLPLDRVNNDGIHLTQEAAQRLSDRISSDIASTERSAITGFLARPLN